jgi:hypothetical protein
LSAPVGPPLPVSVNAIMAPPFPPSCHGKPSAAMAGKARSSCWGETYPWLVRLKIPCSSKLRVPTTQYAAPWCTSGVDSEVYVWSISVDTAPHS